MATSNRQKKGQITSGKGYLAHPEGWDAMVDALSNTTLFLVARQV
jgi:hypothetical protein